MGGRETPGEGGALTLCGRGGPNGMAWWKKRLWAVTGLGALLVALLLWASMQGSRAEVRARRHLGMSPYAQVNETTLREAVLRVAPPGLTEAEVEARLAQTEIGKDGLSRYYPPKRPKEPEGVVQISYDPKVLQVVHTSYGIRFLFDAKHRLRDVWVKEWLTGL